jgi:hypothetical protein
MSLTLNLSPSAPQPARRRRGSTGRIPDGGAWTSPPTPHASARKDPRRTQPGVTLVTWSAGGHSHRGRGRTLQSPPRLGPRPVRPGVGHWPGRTKHRSPHETTTCALLGTGNPSLGGDLVRRPSRIEPGLDRPRPAELLHPQLPGTWPPHGKLAAAPPYPDLLS